MTAGGRACGRWGIWENNRGAPFDIFANMQVRNNLFVQVMADRTAPPSGSQSWGYRDSLEVDYCLAGDTIKPGGCLNHVTPLTTSDFYTDNIEGDPQFVGDPDIMGEDPASLPWHQFRVLSRVVVDAGSSAVNPFAVPSDFEGDRRPMGADVDIGHDEH